MRLIYTTHNSDKARTLANFLSSQGFENNLEMIKGTDWGQEDYGDTLFKIWVIDEDAAEAAEKWGETFENDPQNPMFQKSGFKTTVIPEILNPNEPIMRSGKPRQGLPPRAEKKPAFSITSGLFLLCCIFYLISNLTMPRLAEHSEKKVAIPFLMSPISKNLYFDFPHTYVLIDKLVRLYGFEALESPKTLPPEGQYLYNELQNSTFWQGFYPKLVAYFQNREAPNADAPMFEKIQQGEVWRLFTPALLHNDFLHILFNMLWLLLLGRQLEDRLSPSKYMLLVLITGIVSNTAQYLMSGPNFMGFSGVVCGMVGFIWVRQKVAPWEGYPLEKATSIFLFCFIAALFLLQIGSFYFEVQNDKSYSSGIANTAHISGAITGALLALSPFFKKNMKYGVEQK